MPKRKLADVDIDNETFPGHPKRRKSSQRGDLEGMIENGKKTLYRALRVSRGFERQKLGRRQKIAKAQDASTDSMRLAEEVTALKKLDLLLLGETHLYKALLKSKPISSAPTFPTWIAQKVKKPSSGLDTSGVNVSARLFNSNPVKSALVFVLSNIHNVLNLPADDVPRRKKRLRAADYKTKTEPKVQDSISPQAAQYLDSSQSREKEHVSEIRKEAQSSPEILDSEGESEGYEAYSSRLANSSDGENHISGDVVTGYGSGEDTDNEAQGVPVGNPPFDRVPQSILLSPSVSLSPSPSRSLSPSLPPSSRIPPSTKPTRSTTFLPTLAGGYWSGSEASDSGRSHEEDPSAIKPRKNRRGQQERRAIWEKKYGANANHVKKGVVLERDEGWDPRRGAQDGNGRSRGKGRGGKMNGVGRGLVSSGANSEAIKGTRQRGQHVKSNAKGKEEGPLHPSWEAKKRAKEKAESTAMAFQGKKTTFD